jgi:hypothetical protein
VTFTIGGQSFTLSVLQYFMILNDSQNYICYSVFGVSPINNLWILGDYFLSRFYSIYNINQNQVGFATSIAYNYASPISPGTFQSSTNVTSKSVSLISALNTRYVTGDRMSTFIMILLNFNFFFFFFFENMD